MKLAVPVFIALVLIAATTIFQGNLSERWNQEALATELAAASKRIEDVPRFVGDWKGIDEKADERQIEQARVVGHLSRDFRNVRTGQKVSFFLVCGKPRHVAIHTPDDCYVAAGFEMLSSPEVIELETDDGPIEFYTTIFKRIVGNEKHQVRVFWAWNENGAWEAPEYPRIAYAWGSSLYKMYVISSVRTEADTRFDDDNPAIQFIKAMIPATDSALFPDEETVAARSIDKSDQARSTPEPRSTPQEQPAG